MGALSIFDPGTPRKLQKRIMNPEANKGKAQNIGKFLFLIFIPNYQDVFSKPFVKKKI